MLSYIKRKLKNQVIRLKDWRDAYLFNKYKKKALIPFDKNWFKGKRVAIIGGADSAYKEKLGEYIESFDVVVRVNNGVRVLEMYKEYIGEKTDFLFHTLYEDVEGGGSPIEFDLWERHNVKKVVFSHGLNNIYVMHLKRYLIKYKDRLTIVLQGNGLAKQNFDMISPYHPTTGLIAINSVFLSDPSLIYITGITFFKTAHHQDYRKGSFEYWTKAMKSTLSHHNPDEEYLYFKKLYRSDPAKFQLDATLQQIIDNDNE